MQNNNETVEIDNELKKVANASPAEVLLYHIYQPEYILRSAYNLGVDYYTYLNDMLKLSYDLQDL